MKLFWENKPFYKGNTHCHSTISDGSLSPLEVKTLYRKNGYDFLALTDHRVLSAQTGMENGMLLLSGTEMDYALSNQDVHIIGVGMTDAFARFRHEGSTPQECINAIRACGGRAILAHPAWSLNTTDTLLALKDITAAEVYNSVSTIPLNGERADASVLLDIAAANGAIFNFIAADDSHIYQDEACRSWTMVQAEALTREGILSALDAGRFYCTQGPSFKQLDVEDGLLRVRCSPVDTIIFYNNRSWSGQRCVCRPGQTQAEYRLFQDPRETFVRVQLIDAQGNNAWSNPIRTDALKEVSRCEN